VLGRGQGLKLGVPMPVPQIQLQALLTRSQIYLPPFLPHRWLLRTNVRSSDSSEITSVLAHLRKQKSQHRHRQRQQC